MTDDPDLKKILISLRKRGVINEKNFILSLDRMTVSTRKGHLQFAPLVDMIGVIENDSELHLHETSLKNLGKEVKKTIAALRRQA